MYQHRVVRAHRQHTSTVMTVPKALCRQLGIKPGDYLLLTYRTDAKYAELHRFVGKDGKDAGGKRVAGRGHKRRVPQVKVGERR